MGDAESGGNAERFRHDIKLIVSRISRIDVSELDDGLLIQDELGIDSLKAMEIVATCEKILNLKIDEAAVARVERVGDFIDLLFELAKAERRQEQHPLHAELQ